MRPESGWFSAPRLALVAPGRRLRHGRCVSAKDVVLCTVAALCLGLGGCGHPATREDCQLIFDKSAIIELASQNITDPKLVEERVAAVRAARGAELINACVGKRITDEVMACVRDASSAEVLEKCLQ